MYGSSWEQIKDLDLYTVIFPLCVLCTNVTPKFVYWEINKYFATFNFLEHYVDINKIYIYVV